MNRIMTILAACVICLSLQAQNSEATRQHGPQGNARKEFNPELYHKKMREFVAAEAKLTDTEAAKFFPLLTEMLEKQQRVMKQQRELMMRGKPEANLTEADYEDIITQTTNNDVELKKIEQTYFKKFHAVLSWKKIFAVRQALNRFQREALRHFQPGKNNGHKGNAPAGGTHQK